MKSFPVFQTSWLDATFRGPVVCDLSVRLTEHVIYHIKIAVDNARSSYATWTASTFTKWQDVHIFMYFLLKCSKSTIYLELNKLCLKNQRELPYSTFWIYGLRRSFPVSGEQFKPLANRTLISPHLILYLAIIGFLSTHPYHIRKKMFRPIEHLSFAFSHLPQATFSSYLLLIS